MTLADLSEKLILERMERVGRLCVDAALRDPAFVAAASLPAPDDWKIWARNDDGPPTFLDYGAESVWPPKMENS